MFRLTNNFTPKIETKSENRLVKLCADAGLESNDSLDLILREKTVRDVKLVHPLQKQAEATVFDALNLMVKEQQSMLLLDSQDQLPRFQGTFGVISLADLLRNQKEENSTKRLCEIIARRVLPIDESATLDSALLMMSENEMDQLVVLGPDGNVVGVLTFDGLIFTCRLGLASLRLQ